MIYLSYYNLIVGNDIIQSQLFLIPSPIFCLFCFTNELYLVHSGIIFVTNIVTHDLRRILSSSFWSGEESFGGILFACFLKSVDMITLPRVTNKICDETYACQLKWWHWSPLPKKSPKNNMRLHKASWWKSHYFTYSDIHMYLILQKYQWRSEGFKSLTVTCVCKVFW